MITRLLLRLNLGLCDLDLIARVLASDVLRVHAGALETLGETETRRELRARYATLAVETGLPGAACERVADLAWSHIAAAQEPPPPQRKEFGFYA